MDNMLPQFRFKVVSSLLLAQLVLQWITSCLVHLTVWVKF